jgi:hypothetical protein
MGVFTNIYLGSNKTPSLTEKSLLAFPLKSGFDSHYVKTSIDGYPSHMTNKEEINYYDEFVTVQGTIYFFPFFISLAYIYYLSS